MKLTIISDLHGNINPIFRITRITEKLGIDHVVCLGDTLTQGSNPKEDLAVSWLKSINSLGVQGNHDRPDSIRSRISEENELYLHSLSEKLELPEILAFHSPLSKPDYYLLGEADIEKEYWFLKNQGYPQTFFLFGHTHEQAVYSCDKTSGKILRLKTRPQMFLNPRYDYFINPGALCLHALKGMSFATMDTKKRTLRYHEFKKQ